MGRRYTQLICTDIKNLLIPYIDVQTLTELYYIKEFDQPIYDYLVSSNISAERIQSLDNLYDTMIHLAAHHNDIARLTKLGMIYGNSIADYNGFLKNYLNLNYTTTIVKIHSRIYWTDKFHWDEWHIHVIIPKIIILQFPIGSCVANIRHICSCDSLHYQIFENKNLFVNNSCGRFFCARNKELPERKADAEKFGRIMLFVEMAVDYDNIILIDIINSQNPNKSEFVEYIARYYPYVYQKYIVDRSNIRI